MAASVVSSNRAKPRVVATKYRQSTKSACRLGRGVAVTSRLGMKTAGPVLSTKLWAVVAVVKALWPTGSSGKRPFLERFQYDVFNLCHSDRADPDNKGY